MLLIWTWAAVCLAFSDWPMSFGTTRAASRPRMTMTTMSSRSVKPSRPHRAPAFRIVRILASSTSDLRDFEQGQKDRDDDEADDRPHQQDDERLEERQHSGQSRLDLAVDGVGHLVQEVVELAAFLPDGHHLHEGRGNLGVQAHRLG